MPRWRPCLPDNGLFVERGFRPTDAGLIALKAHATAGHRTAGDVSPG
jgi:hypothetical protein